MDLKETFAAIEQAVTNDKIVQHLAGIDESLKKIADRLPHPVVTIPADAPIKPEEVAAAMAEQPIVAAAAPAPAPTPAKRGPGRPRKNPLPAPAPEQAAAPAPAEEKKPDLKVVPTPAPEPEADPLAEAVEETKKQPEYVPPVPCKGCGVDVNIQGVLHSKACTEVKGGGEAPAAAEPKPVEQPSFEKLREVAVRWAQKFSKAKLLEVVKPFMPEGTTEPKLTLIQDRAAVVARLEKDLAA